MFSIMHIALLLRTKVLNLPVETGEKNLPSVRMKISNITLLGKEIHCCAAASVVWGSIPVI